MKSERISRPIYVLSGLLVGLSLYYTQASFAISGSRWQKLSYDGRVVYIGGVLDAWDHDVASCAKSEAKNPWCTHVKDVYEPVIACSNDRPYVEILAVIEKFMKEHPEERERPMARQIWAALYESCEKGIPQQPGEAPND